MLLLMSSPCQPVDSDIACLYHRSSTSRRTPPSLCFARPSPAAGEVQVSAVLTTVRFKRRGSPFLGDCPGVPNGAPHAALCAAGSCLQALPLCVIALYEVVVFVCELR